MISIRKPFERFGTLKVFLNKGAVVIIAHDGLTIKERIKLIKICLVGRRC